jgi:NADP-reducing hydrogenase subunit HndB
MTIKSLEDLKKIREEYQNQVSLRQRGESLDDRVEILIGMATCGIASGARETFNTFVEEISKEGLSNTKVVSVGCIGYCHSEPIVQVNIPGKEPVLYGKVKKEKVHEIVEKHLKSGTPVESLVLRKDFERA